MFNTGIAKIQREHQKTVQKQGKGQYTYDAHENCPIYIQNYSNPFTLDVQFQRKSPPFQMIINPLKGNRSAFVVSINLLILYACMVFQ